MGRGKGAEKKLPTGITARQYSGGREVLWLTFTYKGRSCRESLGVDNTPKNIKFAEQKRATILLEISRGDFDYNKHFPGSKMAEFFGASRCNMTIGEIFARKFEKQERENLIQASSLSAQRDRHRLHISDTFDHLYPTEVSVKQVEDWISYLSSRLSQKTVTPIRALLADALSDALRWEWIPRNPVAAVKLSAFYSKAKTSTERSERNEDEEDEIDPFELSEAWRVLNAIKIPEHREFFKFMFYTGVRKQEAPLVKWADLDEHRRQLAIKEAIGTKMVYDGAGKRHIEYYVKPTKTYEHRVIDVLHFGWEAIQYMRNTSKVRHTEYIFINPETGEPFNLRRMLGLWTKYCRWAGVRHRSIKQTRHSFASWMRSAGEQDSWLIHQLGHRDSTMLDKHYARWRPPENGGARVTHHDWTASPGIKALQ